MLRAALRQCVTNTGRSVIRFRVRHRSGSIRWLEGVFNNLLGDPDVRAVVNNYRDITQAVAAEEALLKSEEKFAKAFRSSPLAITIMSSWNIGVGAVIFELPPSRHNSFPVAGS